MLRIVQRLRPENEIDCINTETFKKHRKTTHYLALLSQCCLIYGQVPVVRNNESNTNDHSEKDVNKDKIGPDGAYQVKKA